MKATIAELKRQGYGNIFLWVFDENIKARHFYEQFGFSLTDDFLDNNIGGKTCEKSGMFIRYDNFQFFGLNIKDRLQSYRRSISIFIYI